MNRDRRWFIALFCLSSGVATAQQPHEFNLYLEAQAARGHTQALLPVYLQESIDRYLRAADADAKREALGLLRTDLEKLRAESDAEVLRTTAGRLIYDAARWRNLEKAIGVIASVAAVLPEVKTVSFVYSADGDKATLDQVLKNGMQYIVLGQPMDENLMRLINGYGIPKCDEKDLVKLTEAWARPESP
jgi:hypothetical protein